MITDSTVLFAHIDLSKVELELDTIKLQAEKIGGDFLKEQLLFDETSYKSTMRELKNELEKLDKIIRPTHETITKKLGIKELAFLIDFKLGEKIGSAAFLAVSWKNKTEGDINELQSILQNVWHDVQLIPSDDFLFILIQQAEVDAINSWIKTITPSKNSPIIQGLQCLGQDEIKIVIALPEQLREKIMQLRDDNIQIPKEIQRLLLFALQKVEWAATSFSINALFSNEKINDVILTVKTPKRNDAIQLRSLMEYAIEFGVNAGKFQASQKQENVPPLIFEFMKGVLRTLLPDMEDDKLVFRLKGIKSMKKHEVVAVSGIGVALLLPAVKAAREASRTMQCLNNMKQIVLAFHNYHDRYNAFPPLYTVDNDGKPLHSWRVLILPFIERLDLYKKIRLNEPWDSEYNKQFHDTFINVYCCPNNRLVKKDKSCCCSVIAGEVFTPAKDAGEKGNIGMPLGKITDGTSNTLAVVEVKQPFCWMDPTADITLDEFIKGVNKEGRVGSFHTTGINAALFDGSKRLLPNSISKEVLKAIGTYNGGETVTLP
ncbi:MAG: DUF1559 domain-containing protein [Planctomycetaceae bacterium]|nr:DUF1559 domain-containing protein [Planctomycetaceae bacterium]